MVPHHIAPCQATLDHNHVPGLKRDSSYRRDSPVLVGVGRRCLNKTQRAWRSKKVAKIFGGQGARWHETKKCASVQAGKEPGAKQSAHRNLAPSNRHECAWLVVLCGRPDKGRVRQPSAKHPHTSRCAKSDNFATQPTFPGIEGTRVSEGTAQYLLHHVAPLLDKTRHDGPKELRFFFKNITPSESHICHVEHATMA